VSAGTDGSLKVWSLQSSQCLQTLADGHVDKVWAVAVRGDGREMVSVGSDSRLCVWEDRAAEAAAEAFLRSRRRLVAEEELGKAVRRREFAPAARLALRLNMPGKLRAVLEAVHEDESASPAPSPSPSQPPSATASATASAADERLVAFVAGLAAEAGADASMLLRSSRDWNTNSRTSLIAQLTLAGLLRVPSLWGLSGGGDEAAAAGTSAAPLPEAEKAMGALVPFTRRHVARMDRLLQDSYLIDHVLACA